MSRLMLKQMIIVEPQKANKKFDTTYVGCVVLTKDNTILLQQRPTHFLTYPDYVCEFGGKIEPGESPNDALVRELHEELGAQVTLEDVISFGAITESSSDYKELIYTFFWHDKYGSITGCYEGEPRYFNHASEILQLPKITDGLKWVIAQCLTQGLVK